MNEKIKARHLELLYSHLSVSVLTGIVAGSFITIMLWDEVNHVLFSIWLAFFASLLIYRLLILLFFTRSDDTSSHLNLWDNLNFAGTLITGLIWGSLTFFYSSLWPPVVQISLWVLLIALMSGASASISVVLKYYLAYCAPIMLFSLYVQYVDKSYYLMAIFFFYALLLSMTARNFRKQNNFIIEQQIKLIDANNKLEALATKDALTNLPNRRAFENLFRNEWDKHLRSKKHLSLMMLDVDYFKNYNDHYGHSKGDECLRSIANIIQKSLLRPSDVAARYGGEEFIIILPETSKEGALEVAERIHYNLKVMNIPHEFPRPDSRLTVSIGIATLIPESGKNSKVLQLLADRELYKAKANGRNCTSSEEEIEESTSY
jgi:diguanylate cyclase (GGDEF)-like protein